MTKNKIITYLKEHKDDFMKKYQISKLALFGSYSRDENRDDSDVDIAIETSLRRGIRKLFSYKSRYSAFER